MEISLSVQEVSQHQTGELKMKKFIVIAVITLFIATTAFAEPPTGKAIGYDGNLGGLSLRYMMGSIGVQGILGLDFESPAASTSDSAIDLALGVNVFKSLWECDKGQVNCFGGISINMDGDTMKDSDSVTDIGLAVGLEPEIFLLENLSVSTKLGVQIMIEGETRDALGKSEKDSGGLSLGTYGQGVSIVSGVSFNWYF